MGVCVVVCGKGKGRETHEPWWGWGKKAGGVVGGVVVGKVGQGVGAGIGR